MASFVGNYNRPFDSVKSRSIKPNYQGQLITFDLESIVTADLYTVPLGYVLYIHSLSYELSTDAGGRGYIAVDRGGGQYVFNIAFIDLAGIIRTKSGHVNGNPYLILDQSWLIHVQVRTINVHANISFQGYLIDRTKQDYFV